jgi:Ca2+-binding RTX toxin-like protein
MTDKTSKKPNYVIDPKAKIAGKTQSELANKWWQYDLSIPQEDNPTLDRTGDFAGVNQAGDVYFLSGVAGVGIAERNIVVPQGKSIFFPVINSAWIDPTDEADGVNGFNTIVGLVNPLSKFKVFIDGKQVLNLEDSKKQYQSTDYFNGFDVSLPENNIYNGKNNPIAFKSTSQAGYYVGLNPLPVGKHTIEFKAIAPQGEQDISYTIDVKPFNKDITGDDNNNTLKGNWRNDNIDAFGGDDTVYGYGGDDIIDGGAGNDKLYGGNGNDIVYGGAGNDIVYGDCGDDVLAGGLGDDKIYGGDGNDRLYGGSGNDIVYGGNGNDIIYGGNGNDKIDGGNGNDVIDAVADSKLVLPFSSSKDQIDTIKGGEGRDIFVLGMAGDKKVGVTGSAYYVGGGDLDYAVIQDFQLGSNGDKIQLFSQTTTPSDYVLGTVANGLPNGVGIYYTKDNAHDLIGIVQGDNVSLATLSLTNNSQFNLVG